MPDETARQGRFPPAFKARQIATVRSYPEGTGWRMQVIASGDLQPESVSVGGQSAFYQEGSWWVWVPGGRGERLLVAMWSGSPTVQEWVSMPSMPMRPMLASQFVPGVPAQLRLSWPTLLGYAYDIETSTNFSNWTAVPSGRAFGGGDPMVFLHSMPEPSGFFRVNTRRLGD
jgi:hypothetical protein